MAASVKSKSRLAGRSDIYFCALGGFSLGLYAILTHFWVIDRGPLGEVPTAMLGAGLLVFPGYSLCRALGLDQHGTAVLGGLSFALSLALLAVAGAGAWLMVQELDITAIETAVLALTISFCAVAALRSTEVDGALKGAPERWTALGLVLVPLLVGAVAFSPDLPVTAAARHTEFYLNTHTTPLTVDIYNAEGRTVTYTLVADDGHRQESIGPIDPGVDGRWEGKSPIAPPVGGTLHLYLYRYGTHQPYRLLVIAGDNP